MTKYLFLIVTIIVLSQIGCNNNNNQAEVTKLNNAGIEFMEKQNFSSAEVKFQEALRLKQTDESKADIYRNLATVHFNLDQMDSSLKYSEKAYKISPKNSYLYFINKAEYHLMKYEVQLAIPLLEKAKSLEPERMESYSNLSLIYNGNYGEEFINLDKALTFAQKSYSIEATAANEEQLASVFFQNEMYAKSSQHYQSLMKRYPEVKIYQLYAGNSLYAEGKRQKGSAMMEDAAARDETCRMLLNELIESN